MKIKKIGHCCLVVEISGVRIMTDPGSFSTAQTEEKNVDVVLITHEHGDHIHIESLKKVLENNPNCKVITNSAVKKLLDQENIVCNVFEEGEQKIDLPSLGEGGAAGRGLELFAKTCPHADIFDGVIPVQNTGYMINGRLFYPGDAWLEIDRPVEILALPVAGPWSKIRDAVEYAMRVNPKHAFPVHDGIIKDSAVNIFSWLPEKVLNENGIKFKPLKAGESLEI